jgi:hypothetical protein
MMVRLQASPFYQGKKQFLPKICTVKYLLTVFLLLNVLSHTSQVKNLPDTSKFTYSIEVPAVHELIFIIYALTDVGATDSVMIHHNSDYYKKVMNHFGSFREEKIVKSIDKKIRTSYNQIRMDAANYSINSNNEITKNCKYKNLSWGNKDYIKRYLSDLKTFCVKTGFFEFYKNNSTYYDSLKGLMQKQCAIEKQYLWLEKNFPIHHHSYRIIFSPLSKGKHATNVSLEDVVVFVSGPTQNSDLSETLLEARDSRMLFTEIDHNYVNPISDLHQKEIKKAFRNKHGWVRPDVSDDYVNEYAVFNEYMTWAVYLLYAKDTYSSSDFEVIRKNIEEFMVFQRGFLIFRWFTEQMLELYRRKEAERPISDLYWFILFYCKSI